MNSKALLIVTALIEAGAGFALLVVPSLAADVLLGAELTSPQALVIARIGGVALLSIAIACWLARHGQRREQSGLIAGLLLYNLAVPVLLIHGSMAWALEGLGVWPASALHALLALWCVVCLRTLRDGKTAT